MPGLAVDDQRTGGLPQALQCSVVIPAYNEEAVIGRCLETLLADAPRDHGMQIIVAANGCRDATVERARAAAPQARILDLDEGSKTAAINAANNVASHYPRIYLDADVECSYGTVMALVEALGEPGVMTAAPAIRQDTSRSDWWVRAYFRVWMQQPYACSGNGGAGCYGLSRAALQEIGQFPDIIGDDIWIHTRFPQSSKRYVPQDRQGRPVFTVVRPPHNAIEQIRVEARRQLGNSEVLRRHPSPFNLRSSGKGALREAIRRRSNPVDVAVFFGMKLAARLLARWSRWRGKDAVWSRDQSSREPSE